MLICFDQIVLVVKGRKGVELVEKEGTCLSSEDFDG